MPAIAIADGSISSSFLTLFGRSARATGMANERNNKPVSAQWLHMLNSSQIQRKLETGPKLKTIFDFDAQARRDRGRSLFDRPLPAPHRRESARLVEEYLKANPNKSAATIDLTWSLLNSPEFLYRH